MAKTISIMLREAIVKSGKSAGEIAKATGVPQSTVTRFLNGGNMRLSWADTIAAHLCVEVKPSLTWVSGKMLPDKVKRPRTIDKKLNPRGKPRRTS